MHTVGNTNPSQPIKGQYSRGAAAAASSLKIKSCKSCTLLRLSANHIYSSKSGASAPAAAAAAACDMQKAWNAVPSSSTVMPLLLLLLPCEAPCVDLCVAPCVAPCEPPCEAFVGPAACCLSCCSSCLRASFSLLANCGFTSCGQQEQKHQGQCQQQGQGQRIVSGTGIDGSKGSPDCAVSDRSWLHNKQRRSQHQIRTKPLLPNVLHAQPPHAQWLAQLLSVRASEASSQRPNTPACSFRWHHVQC
jgi:hypothetical protein